MHRWCVGRWAGYRACLSEGGGNTIPRPPLRWSFYPVAPLGRSPRLSHSQSISLSADYLSLRLLQVHYKIVTQVLALQAVAAMSFGLTLRPDTP